MTIVVRRAVASDVDWISDQLSEFSKFFDSHHSLYSTKEYVQKSILNLIEHHYVAVAHGCSPKGIIKRMGFIAGVLTPHPFNPEIMLLSEQLWWVEPESRHTRAGLLLLNEYVKFGKENADWITFGVEEKSPINERSLLKRGFKLQERSYLQEVV